MRFVTKAKIFLGIILLILIIIFFRQNTHHVGIQFPFGRPYQFRLIYMLLIAFTSGILTALLIGIGIIRTIKRKEALENSQELVEEE